MDRPRRQNAGVKMDSYLSAMKQQDDNSDEYSDGAAGTDREAASTPVQPRVTEASPPAECIDQLEEECKTLERELKRLRLQKKRDILQQELLQEATPGSDSPSSSTDAILAGQRTHDNEARVQPQRECIPGDQTASLPGQNCRIYGLDHKRNGAGNQAEPPSRIKEIVYSFDTTGSMSRCIHEVRSGLKDMMTRLQADIPGIRIAIFAHGDYCDAYDTRYIDFTNNIDELCTFVNDTQDTGGGDYAECYEKVLLEVQTKLSWTAGSQRSLVMIGDAIPHEVSFPGNEQNINWKEEVEKLRKMGVKIYSVQFNDNPGSAEFFKYMAAETSGKHVECADVSNIQVVIITICYREVGVEYVRKYEEEVRAKHTDGKIPKDLEGMFTTLRTDDEQSHFGLNELITVMTRFIRENLPQALYSFKRAICSPVMIPYIPLFVLFVSFVFLPFSFISFFFYLLFFPFQWSFHLLFYIFVFALFFFCWLCFFALLFLVLESRFEYLLIRFRVQLESDTD